MKQLIRITSETCTACIVMCEVMRRIMPEFPDIEIIDLDKDLDREEVCAITSNRSVPLLKYEDKELVGSHTMDECREFLRSL